MIYSAWANANRDLTVLVGAETPEEEKGVWRRDWTFTQDMLEDLTGRHDLSKDGLGTNYPYLPLTADEALAVADDDEKFFDQNGYEYVPGAGFDRTDENGYWDFMAYGTGDYKASRRAVQGPVLLQGRDRELPRRRRVGAHAAACGRYGERLGELRLRRRHPGPAAECEGSAMPATSCCRPLLEEARKKAGDLIILSRPATSTESSHTSGAYVNYGDASEGRAVDPVDPTDPCEHEDLLGQTVPCDGADGFCDKCGDCLHEKDSRRACAPIPTATTQARAARVSRLRALTST